MRSAEIFSEPNQVARSRASAALANSDGWRLKTTEGNPAAGSAGHDAEEQHVEQQDGDAAVEHRRVLGQGAVVDEQHDGHRHEADADGRQLRVELAADAAANRVVGRAVDHQQPDAGRASARRPAGSSRGACRGAVQTSQHLRVPGNREPGTSARQPAALARPHRAPPARVRARRRLAAAGRDGGRRRRRAACRAAGRVRRDDGGARGRRRARARQAGAPASAASVLPAWRTRSPS